ncbi:hypothetical protein KKF84_08130 [Myxococcota bacterium]|nr:hypothetical protein [Myxococcota bacterium]MBU1535275.1 hypothetical protein [Myxococcota bacterium]
MKTTALSLMLLLFVLLSACDDDTTVNNSNNSNNVNNINNTNNINNVNNTNNVNNHNPVCDDGTEAQCDMIQPQCDEDEILAIQDECWICVNPSTCAPWGMPTCVLDGDCVENQYCDMCASSSCPECDNCVAACVDHTCATWEALICDQGRPECSPGNTAIVQDGCWVCVEIYTCDVVRDSTCDDGTNPICEMVEPVCEDYEILAYQDDCYACVNPVSCEPWGTAGCENDLDCNHLEYCDSCATSSAPLLGDCVAGCVSHGCETEPIALCNTMRPDCGEGNTAVIVDQCYQCVAVETCLPVD